MNRWRAAPLIVIAAGALLIANAGLGVALWRGGIADSEPVEPAVADWAPPAIQPDNVVSRRKPIEAYSQTLARPVFSKSRQPWSKPSPAPAPVAMAAAAPAAADAQRENDFTLTGVAITAGSRQAFMMSKSRPEGLWVSEGEKLGDWTLASVTPTGAVLLSSERRLLLPLYPP